MSKDNDRKNSLDLAISSIVKQFGKGSIMRLNGEGAAFDDIPVISTGALSLDIALGIGGVPRGRVVEIFGPESSGKTSLALHIVAQANRTGGVAAFIDAEHALDVKYARNLGVKTDDLFVSQPDTGEQALEIADMLVRSGALDVLVIDSVAALVPRAEIEGEMGDSHMGLQARLMSQALRKLTGSISKSHTCVIFINQIRMKIGVMFGNPETTSGGNALKFYSSVRLDIRRIGAIKKGNEIIGNRTRVKVVKNKLAPPFRVCEFDIIFNRGISRLGDLIDLAVDAEIIDKSGAWYSFGDERIGQGRENVRDLLVENKDMRLEIEKRVREHYELPPITTAPPATPPTVDEPPAPEVAPSIDGGNGKDPNLRIEPAAPATSSRRGRRPQRAH
ncbi:MAG TPA: recombinase RecA [Myxococcota bacterium]|nr:recombinase RecA [Myxococcota bacterium]